MRSVFACRRERELVGIVYRRRGVLITTSAGGPRRRARRGRVGPGIRERERLQYSTHTKAAARAADERFVFIVSDADLERHAIAAHL